MARVSIERTYPDGDRVHITVVADDSFPDALDQARGVAVRGFTEIIGASESTWVRADLDFTTEGE